MTTQNITPYRTTFTDLATGDYYYPGATGTEGDGYDNIEVEFHLTSDDVDNGLTLTVEADDGTTLTFAWNESMGMYDWSTGAYGAASWTVTNGTIAARLSAFNHNAKRWRIHLNVDTNAQPAANSGILVIRKVKV